MTDYLLCSEKIAESWSARTAGAASEGAREIDCIRRTRRSDEMTYDTYVPLRGRRPVPGLFDSPIINAYFPLVGAGVGGNAEDSWGIAKLQRRIEELGKATRPEMGVVYFHPRPGTPLDPTRHFRSALDSYFRLSEEEIRRAAEEAKTVVMRVVGE